MDLHRLGREEESLRMVVLVVMGVCGSGKTTVAKALAKTFSCEFADADDWHPASNVEKMSKGIPLDDEDRQPWLMALHRLLLRWEGESVDRKQQGSLVETTDATDDTGIELEPHVVPGNTKPREPEPCQPGVDPGGHFEVRGSRHQSPSVVAGKGADSHGLNTVSDKGGVAVSGDRRSNSGLPHGSDTNSGEQLGSHELPKRPNTDSDTGAELQKEIESRSHCIKPNFEPMNMRIEGSLACSALKKHYRQTLSRGTNPSSKVNCIFVVLNGSEALIQERMSNREHFMPPGLLRSQFEALELPLGEEEGGNPVIMISDISKPVGEIVECIVEKLKQIL